MGYAFTRVRMLRLRAHLCVKLASTVGVKLGQLVPLLGLEAREGHRAGLHLTHFFAKLQGFGASACTAGRCRDNAGTGQREKGSVQHSVRQYAVEHLGEFGFNHHAVRVDVERRKDLTENDGERVQSD